MRAVGAARRWRTRFRPAIATRCGDSQETRRRCNAAEADGTTPLHWAVRADDLETVALLLEAGANANAANRYGVTPLSLAAVNGNAAMIEALLAAGADAEERRCRAGRPC